MALVKMAVTVSKTDYGTYGADRQIRQLIGAAAEVLAHHEGEASRLAVGSRPSSWQGRSTMTLSFVIKKGSK